jgi:predicted Zn-dependent protease
MNGAAAIHAAQARLRAGDAAGAERVLLEALRLAPGDAILFAAHGDLLLEVGHAAEAADSLGRSLSLDPRSMPVLGRFVEACLQAGRPAEAETAARRLVEEAPSARAWELLARALRQQGKMEEALSASNMAIRADPDDAQAQAGRASLLPAFGRYEEAIAIYDGLLRRGADGAAIRFNRAMALVNLGRLEEAGRELTHGLKQGQDARLHGALANVRWMMGEGMKAARDYRAAAASRPDDLGLVLGCADTLRGMQASEEAIAMLQAAAKRMPDSPQVLTSLGVMLGEVGRPREAVPLLLRSVALAPRESAMRANLAAALLQVGAPAEALSQIRPARALDPINQEWLCYETMALRQLGDPRYHELCDYALMVRTYEIEPPVGFESVEAFNAAFADSLARLHRLDAHPLDQSLRNGSQTTRDLLLVPDPVIQAYFTALDAPIRAYMDLMRKPGHPWSGRKTGGYRLAGAWSVRLQPGGFHVNHLHPRGWISSAYYVSLPAESPGSDDRSGWLKFGEPPWPAPGLAAELHLRPLPGRLVLFPSYFWHGTLPIEDGIRLTAPFDVLPA